MNTETRQEIHIPLDKPMDELRHTDHEAFTGEVKALIKEAENTRLHYMELRQNRGFTSMTIGILSVLLGGAAFGWYFLVEGDLMRALACVGVSILPQLFLHSWVNAPLKGYVRAHKAQFMPKLAKAMGGFRYNADGGISAKILGPTGIVPPHDRYNSEDCFIGTYKGIKVLFAEARLYKGSQKIFQGLFVLLELPKSIVNGHLILTADKKMADAWASTRWQKMSVVPVTTSNPEWNRFLAFAEKPEEVKTIVTEQLMKELSEAADIFNRAPLSAAFVKGKYIFIAIPTTEDMFEASAVQIPIPTTEHMETRRKEIGKLLEVIDVFEIYGKQ